MAAMIRSRSRAPGKPVSMIAVWPVGVTYSAAFPPSTSTTQMSSGFVGLPCAASSTAVRSAVDKPATMRFIDSPVGPTFRACEKLLPWLPPSGGRSSSCRRKLPPEGGSHESLSLRSLSPWVEDRRHGHTPIPDLTVVPDQLDGTRLQFVRVDGVGRHRLECRVVVHL